ncbi:hypothetical protein E4T42_07905 [Aureobasidium subglaciale]|nr:hypothetical protein E4T42_07905 [Aureobasidium subglaciale]
MRSFVNFAALASSLFHLSTVNAIPTPLKRASAPPLPQDVTFYLASSGFESSAPSTILKSRPLKDFSFSGSVPLQVQAAYQLLSRTTDSLGNAQVAASTIIVPQNANFSRLLSYQTAEDAAWDGCAPSFSSTNVLNTINNGLFAGLAAMGINGLANGYPQLQAYLDQHLINGSAAAFKKPLTQCLGDDTNQFIFKSIYIFFDNGQDCGCRRRQERIE